ncbi:MAG: DUF3540 domain-containing protein [Myxococcota bacterium]
MNAARGSTAGMGTAEVSTAGMGPAGMGTTGMSPAEVSTAVAMQNVLRIGRVLRRSDAGYLVERDGEVVGGATRAVSCLVEPVSGDEVLCVTVDDRIVIIAVIATSAPQVQVGADAEMVFGTSSRPLQVVSSTLQLAAQDLSFDGHKAEFRSEVTRVCSERLELRARFVHLIGDLVEAVSRQVVQTAESVFRTVVGKETLRAGALEFRAQQTARLDAEMTSVTARNLVHVDGAQVQVG